MDEADGSPPPGRLDAGLEEIREYIAAVVDAVNELATAVQHVDHQIASVQHGIIEGMSTLARALDERLDRLGAPGEGAGRGAVALDPGLAETISTSLAAINRRLEGVGRVGPVLTDLAAWMSGMVDRQDKVEAELIRLGDEVQSYRRRMQVRARPPVLTDQQADSIVSRVLDGLVDLAAQQRATEVALPAEPEPEPERTRRRRR